MASVGYVTPVAGTPNKHSAPAAVRREAFYFASNGQPLFAWLHHPAQSSGHGVVLCAPLGYEQVHAHRSFRVLADQLAASGVTALRFDYHGAGDSAGCDEDADRLPTWLGNIRDAIHFLRDDVGCEKISLAGLRFGATLAMQAATLEEIHALFLWAPVINGRHYVREMKALGLTATIKPPATDAPYNIEAAGFVLTKETADEMSKIDLLKAAPQCRRAFILARDDIAEDRRLLEHLTAHNIAASQSALPGYADMMAEPHFSTVPLEAIASAVSWLRTDDRMAERNVERPNAQEASISSGVRERIEMIGGSVISVHCEPALTRATELPLVVMLNAGAAYRIGPNRISVLLARALAARGFRSVRLDATGLGDNVPVGEAGVNDAYAATAFRDIESVLESAKKSRPAERVVLLGLCSGAYFAFQSAVQLADPALVESVLINPLTFFWKEGMTIDDSPTREDQIADYYWRSAVKPGKWLKLLSGQSKIGFAGAFAQFWRRWQQQPHAQGPAAALADGPAGHPRRDDLPADLTRLALRDRPLTCFFSSADPGFHIMNVRAKNKMQELQKSGQLSLTFIEDADHTFSFRGPRTRLIDAICDQLSRRYGANL
jgi:alpha-beta hydrolase superfamily lysophospholipase